jgi:hypothetical protein
LYVSIPTNCFPQIASIMKQEPGGCGYQAVAASLSRIEPLQTTRTAFSLLKCSGLQSNVSVSTRGSHTLRLSHLSLSLKLQSQKK